MSPRKGEWTLMMEVWAPDFVMYTYSDNHAARMADAKDIHDASTWVIHTMVSYILRDADTSDLGLWQFIYILQVFMRSLKTWLDLLKWFGWAFHVELQAPFLNMLLRQDESRGGGAWKSTS
jgi:hypothetical protein